MRHPAVVGRSHLAMRHFPVRRAGSLAVQIVTVLVGSRVSTMNVAVVPGVLFVSRLGPMPPRRSLIHWAPTGAIPQSALQLGDARDKRRLRRLDPNVW